MSFSPRAEREEDLLSHELINAANAIHTSGVSGEADLSRTSSDRRV